MWGAIGPSSHHLQETGAQEPAQSDSRLATVIPPASDPGLKLSSASICRLVRLQTPLNSWAYFCENVSSHYFSYKRVGFSHIHSFNHWPIQLSSHQCLPVNFLHLLLMDTIALSSSILPGSPHLYTHCFPAEETQTLLSADSMLSSGREISEARF